MKDLFSFKLYKQGLKIIKTPTIYAFISIIILNFAYVSKYAPSDKNSNIPSQLLAPYSFLAYFFAAYLVYHIFSYTKDKTASDLFEALPPKRICLLFTFGASVSTWISAVIVLTNVINSIAFNLFTNYTSSFISLLSSIAIQLLFSFFVITASLCAVAISGSAISYALSTASIMLTSSVIYLCIFAFFSKDIPHIRNSYLFFVQKYMFYNRYPSSIGGSTPSFENIISFTVETIYYLFPNIFELKAQSVVMTLALLPLSVFLFSKRKSYNAGIKELKRPLATLISVTFSPIIVILLLPSANISDSELFIPFLTVAVFFIISTVILKNVKKALTILPFSLVSFAIIFVIVLMSIRVAF